MDASIRPTDDLDALIAARRAALTQPGPVAPPAQHDDLDALIASRQSALAGGTAGLPSGMERPPENAVVRGGELLASTLGQMVTHPIDSAKGMYSSMAQAFKTSGGYLGQRAAELTLPSDVRAMAEADPSRINGKDAAIAGAQVGTLLLPGIGRGAAGLLETVAPRAAARTAALLGTGAAAGAAFNPSDPAAGAVAGAGLAGAGDLAGKLVRGGGGLLIDIRNARPMETTPVKVGPLNLGSIEGVRDRATRLNLNAMGGTPSADGLSPFSEKPVAPLDVFGTPGMRAARALNTASPAAQAILREGLEGRSDSAVPRVIDHAMENMGLTSRESGIRLTDDLIKARSAEADAAWPPVFAKYPNAINDPRIAQLMSTDAGPIAWRQVPKLMRNRFINPPEANTSTFDTSKMDPKTAAMYQRLVDMNGVDAADKAMAALGETPNATPTDVPPMNLQQLHYWAKALDMLADPGDRRGPGAVGNAYGDAQAVKGLARMAREIASDHSEEYRQLRGNYADDSDLIRASDLGNRLFTQHPDKTAIELQQLPPTSHDVFRRAGFDALAQRLEGGSDNVERSVGKALDQKRMQMLFPDQQSFADFKNGLSEEAQMHANKVGTLTGSNTADKLSDLADMVGVTLPDIARALATGRVHRVLGSVAANTTGRLLRAGNDAVRVEQARQLVAGANGDIAARNDALARLGVISPQRPSTTARAWSQQAAMYTPEQIAGTRPSASQTLGGPSPTQPRIPKWTPVVGDFQQGQAVPLRMVPERRLPSAGPTPQPTAGTSVLGPAIPTGGEGLEQAVQAALFRLYQKNPRWAVSLSPEEQARVSAGVRAALSNPPTPR